MWVDAPYGSQRIVHVATPLSDEAMVAAHPDGVREVGCVTEEPDAALMARLREGDALALHRLMHRYWKLLVARAHAILGDEDAAADAAQQTFISLWQHRGEWRATSSVGGLLFRMARNLALNDRRNRRNRARSDAARVSRPFATPCTP